MNVFEHTNRLTTRVHDELIAWAAGLMQKSGLDVVDVWGRFPPEGATRSHLVVFPYRVGPDPKLIDYVPSVSLLAAPGRSEARNSEIPVEWSELGMHLSHYLEYLYPSIAPPDPRRQFSSSPYPLTSELPAPLRKWYEAQDRSEEGPGWVVEDEAGLHARPPALMWHTGTVVSAYYICVAGDPGRGTSSSTSDTAPLALAALSVLSMGIQHNRTIRVKVPARPIPDGFYDFIEAYAASCKGLGPQDTGEDAPAQMLKMLEFIRAESVGEFQLDPVHDLNNQEFALLTQALQRPLQAVLNLRLRIPVGSGPDFMPSSQIVLNTGRKRGGSGGR